MAPLWDTTATLSLMLVPTLMLAVTTLTPVEPSTSLSVRLWQSPTEDIMEDMEDMEDMEEDMEDMEDMDMEDIVLMAVKVLFVSYIRLLTVIYAKQKLNGLTLTGRDCSVLASHLGMC